MIILNSFLLFKVINIYSDGSCIIDNSLEKTVFYKKMVFNEKDIKFEQNFNFKKSTFKLNKLNTLKNINYREKLLK